MPNIGAPELAIILVIVLVIFGPKRLPGLGRQLGTGMREFKDSISGDTKTPALTQAAQQPQAAQPPAEAPVAQPAAAPAPVAAPPAQAPAEPTRQA